MDAVASELDAISAIGGASTAPFAVVYVTLTKLEHIQLVMDARYLLAVVSQRANMAVRLRC